MEQNKQTTGPQTMVWWVKLFIGFILGALVAGYLLNSCSTTLRMPYDVPIETINVKYDTVFIPQVRRVTRNVTIPVPYRVDSLIIDTTYTQGVVAGVLRDKLATRYYKDSVTMEKDISITYDAKVNGTLESMKLGFHDNRPVMMIIKDSTTTLKLPTRGFYAGAFGGPTSFGPSLSYVTPKHLFSVKYNVVPAFNASVVQGVQVEVGFRIGGKKK